MILMPDYGVKLKDNFVKTNNLLDNKNTITVSNSDKNVYVFAVPALFITDKLVTSKELENAKKYLDKNLDKNLKMLFEQQNQQVTQTVCDIETEFFVTVMDY